MNRPFYLLPGVICCFLLCLPFLGWGQGSAAPDTSLRMYDNVFGTPEHFRSGRDNWAVVVVDMDRDGNPDVVSASKSDGLISIHYNDGKGDYKKKRSVKVQDSHRSMVSLDANGDGWSDIATITTRGKLCILLNNGAGYFKRPQVLYSGSGGHDIAHTDLDQDGDLDLITVAQRDEVFSIHLNDGSGKFLPAKSYKTGESPRCLALGDIDKDGLIDIVIGGDKNNLYIHKGKGNNTFSAETQIRSCKQTWGLGLADFNMDGYLDIAACSYITQDLFIHLNKGNGEFHREQEVKSGDHNFNLVVTDLDRDNDPDIVTCSNGDNSINFHLNDGKGIFSDRLHRATGRRPVSIGKGDFDGDGDEDIVTGSVDDANINVHRNFIMERNVVERRMKFFVKGKVFDKDKEIILPNVSVALRLDADKGLVATTFTDENGYFEFETKPNTNYTLVARTKGLPVGRVKFKMPESQYKQDIYLARPTETTVRGKVVDRRTGEPIEQAALTLFDPDGKVIKEGKSNANGEFTYRKISIGYNYEVLVRAEGYEEQSEYFDVERSDIGKGVDVVVRLSKEPTGRCVTGLITDKSTGAPVPRAGLIFKDSTGRTRAKFRANEEGKYRKCLPYGPYELITIAKGYFYQVSEFELEKVEENEDFVFDVALKPLEKDSAILLNVYFDKDKSIVKEEFFPELRRAIKIMEQNPDLVMEIAGHTSSEGNDIYNQRLSQRRSDAVVKHLVDNGIDSNRLIAKGYGESKLVIDPDDTPEKRERNRRTEFKVVKTSTGQSRGSND